jgi:single-stranded-DNA-specific exonuclease
MGHFDADGLSALAILVRALQADGRETAVRIVGKGENPWSDAIRAELAASASAGSSPPTSACDPGAIAAGVPTIVIDHHVPTGEPTEATVITGHGMDPIPTSSLLAYWCASALTDPEPLLWLAAIGPDRRHGRRAPASLSSPKPSAATARPRCATPSRLLNAPGAPAAADAGPSLALLLKGNGPKDVTSGVDPETAVLRAAKAEVAAELDVAKRAPPKVRGPVALIRFHSPARFHADRPAVARPAEGQGRAGRQHRLPPGLGPLRARSARTAT